MHDLDAWADQAIHIANESSGEAYWQARLNHPATRGLFARLEQEMDNQ